MSEILTVARKDFADAGRSRMLWGAVLLMTLVVAVTWSNSYRGIVDHPLRSAVDLYKFWIPPVAIALGYRSVAGERESGRIRVLLGLSATRRDVVLGKFLGRTLVIVVTLALSLAAVAVVVSFRTGTVGVRTLVEGILLLALYGLVWTGLTVGVSSAVSSSTRAVAALVGGYVLFGPFWRPLALPLFALAFTGSSSPSGIDRGDLLVGLTEPVWYLYAQRLNPVKAFEAAQFYLPALPDVVLRGVATDVPHYPNLFGLAVLLAWAFLPVALGYWRFERADLG